MLCSEGGIDAQRLRTGQLEDEEWTRLVETANRLNSAPIYIDDTAGITVMEMRSKARRLNTTPAALPESSADLSVHIEPKSN